MAENKWEIDGHHYTCPECGNIMAIIENESDEGFEFCPFCGKRMSGQMAENKMAEVAKLFGKKLGEEFTVKDKYKTEWHCKFTKRGLLYLDKTFFDWQESGDYLLQFLLTGKAVIIDD
jgi:hypothetical protein